MTEDKPTGILPSAAPAHYAQSCTVSRVGNDFVVALFTPRQSFGPGVPEGQQAFLNEHVVSLLFSVAGLKDLVTVATEQLQAYEQEYGEVVTEFLRRKDRVLPATKTKQ